jgi:SAM-dependent methyltransferase
VVWEVKEALDARAHQRTLQLLGVSAPRILDVGGGTGEISEQFVRQTDGQASATVVDIDADSIRVARERGLDGFVGRFQDFDTAEQFHLVLMLNLIEHVADPVAILSKARQLLAPTGIVWLQTPNFRALDARIFRHRNWGGYHCPRHWVIFSEEGLRSALARTGFKPVRFRRTQGGSFWAASLLGLRRARRARRTWGSSTEHRAVGGTNVPELPQPLIQSPAYMPLAAAGAAFDLLTKPLRQVSQVAVIARPR